VVEVAGVFVLDAALDAEDVVDGAGVFVLDAALDAEDVVDGAGVFVLDAALDAEGVVDGAGVLVAEGVVDEPGVFDAEGVVDEPGVFDAEGVVDEPGVFDAEGVVDEPGVFDAEGVVDGAGVLVLDVEAVREVECTGVLDLEANWDLVGAGLGSVRVGLDPQLYVDGGQTKVTLSFARMNGKHTSLFKSGCWQGPVVKWWHIELQPVLRGKSFAS